MSYLSVYSTSFFFFFKQKTAYEMRISDWSSDVCSSDLMANRKKPGTPGKDSEVGYCRPPKAGQFKKGQSGNPAGKRPGTKHLGALLDRELDMTIAVTEGGKIIRISKRELMVKAVVNTAVKGDLRDRKSTRLNSSH